MSTFETIEKLNTYLVEYSTKLTIYEYIPKLHEHFYAHVDLSFMDYFLNYIDKDGEFIIDAQESLYQFKAISEKKKDSSNILRTLNRSGLIENKDYQLLQLEELRSQGGTSIINKYMLTPDAFKKVLLDVHNHELRKKNIDYYLFLEKTIKHYQDYTIMYKDFLLSGKDTKIDNLNKKIDEQSRKIDEILGRTDDIKSQNEDLKKEVHKVNEKLDRMEYYVKNVFQVIDNNSISMFQTNCIILYKLTYVNGAIKYFISSRQLIDIIKTCKEKQKDSSIQSIQHVKVFEPSNNVGLMKMIKQALKSNKKIKIQYNTIEMDASQEELLIQTIEKILHGSKYNVFEKLGIQHNENHINAYTYIYNALVDRMFSTYFQQSKDITKKIIQEIYNKLKEELPKEK